MGDKKADLQQIQKEVFMSFKQNIIKPKKGNCGLVIKSRKDGKACSKTRNQGAAKCFTCPFK